MDNADGNKRLFAERLFEFLDTLKEQVESGDLILTDGRINVEKVPSPFVSAKGQPMVDPSREESKVILFLQIKGDIMQCVPNIKH